MSRIAVDHSRSSFHLHWRILVLALVNYAPCRGCSPTSEPTLAQLFDFSSAVVSARVTATYRTSSSPDDPVLPDGMYTTKLHVYCQYKGDEIMPSREFNVSMAGFNHGRCTDVNLKKGGAYIMWLLKVNGAWQHVSATPLRMTTTNMAKLKRICGADIRRINVSKDNPAYRQCQPPSKPLKGCKKIPRYKIARIGESKSCGPSRGHIHPLTSLLVMIAAVYFL